MIDLRGFDVLTFDCYGTLVDWEAGILDAVRSLLSDHGVSDEDDAILERFGRLEAREEEGPYRPYEEVLTAVARGMAREYGFEAAPDEARCLVHSLPVWPLFPDTVEALERLAGRYRLGVVSNVDDALFAATAPSLGVPFDPVVTAEQVGSYKPDPRNFHELIRRIGLPRERVLHVAQSLYHDIGPANRLGIAAVWVDRRGGRGAGATKPAEARPDLVVPDLETLANLAGARG